jgi:mycofactocin precursor peptide peptidase
MRGSAAPPAASLGLGQQRWPRLDPGEVLLLVPVGSVEQHGPHLPLATDTMIANAVTRAAAERLDATGTTVLVAPSVNYGASGEHEGFPGTVSIGHEALFLLLAEFGRSAARWAGGVIFVNGHGGNTATLTKVVDLLRYEGRAVAWTSTALPDSDAHAGETETSILRFLAPWSVRVDLMAPGATEPVAELMPRLKAEGVRSVSANGVLGDPTASSVEHGRELFDRMVRNLVAELTALDVGQNGRLAGVVPRREPLGTP